MSSQQQEIWQSFKAGNWEAYTSLYEDHFRLLCNYGYKFTQHSALIEDTIHDLFVKLWNNRQNLGEPASVKNYLFKAFRGLLFRKIKKEWSFSHLWPGEDEKYDFEIAYDQHIILTEEHQALQQRIAEAMETLSGRQREIIYLRFFEALSYEEIADIMNISVNSTYKLLYKTLDKLRATMGAAFVLWLIELRTAVHVEMN
ncbi:RNA polymerase sigma factor (sigma-70 family) [Chitinophaga skermanii]|uniref:RNA polymerase sigma factor (Sigma-70 family) n=1 Tax=Chitinophaga skermanii TaxID=331697 RepID=A0A327QZ52_9BACT|nr:sigma-70 family RNA polymerase sigma factor [Chitinophaga skermanii]RAJ08922.1 RNA polymerase sigma factor (sigma-70 family) [Chitinophaga skermanii]